MALLNVMAASSLVLEHLLAPDYLIKDDVPAPAKPNPNPVS